MGSGIVTEVGLLWRALVEIPTEIDTLT